MVEIGVEFVAATVPTILVAGGILLIIFGFFNNSNNMIVAGWILTISSISTFLIEIFFGAGKGRPK